VLVLVEVVGVVVVMVVVVVIVAVVVVVVVVGMYPDLTRATSLMRVYKTTSSSCLLRLLS
jgi:hypothetical protein